MLAQLHGAVRKVHFAPRAQPQGARHARARHRTPDLRHEDAALVSSTFSLMRADLYRNQYHFDRIGGHSSLVLQYPYIIEVKTYIGRFG